MSHLFYKVKAALTNGMRPGEQHRADEFAGCDLDWLIASEAVEGIGTHVPGMPTMIAPPTTDDPGQLKSEIIRLQQQNHMLMTGQAAADQFHQQQPQVSGTMPAATRLPSPDNMEDARRLQSAQASAEQKIRQESVIPVNPVWRNPGQNEPAPTQPQILYPHRPGAVSFDFSPMMKLIEDSRDAVIDEIRRYHTDGQAEANVRREFTNEDVKELQSALKATQNAAADYKNQLDELRQKYSQQPAPEPAPEPETQQPPKPEPLPAPRQTPSRSKGPEKPIK